MTRDEAEHIVSLFGRGLDVEVAKAQGWTKTEFTFPSDWHGVPPEGGPARIIPWYASSRSVAIAQFKGEYIFQSFEVIRFGKVTSLVYLTPYPQMFFQMDWHWRMEGKTEAEALLRLWLQVEYLPTQIEDATHE